MKRKGTKRKYTDEQLDYIKIKYKRGTAKEIAEEFGVSVGTIHHLAARYGFTKLPAKPRKYKKRPWKCFTESDKAFIKENYGKYKVQELADILNKKKSQVQGYIFDFKIKRSTKAVTKDLDAAAHKIRFTTLRSNAKSRGIAVDLTMEKFVEYSKLNCFYCLSDPKPTNPFASAGPTYRKYSTWEFRKDVVVYVNGLDRIDSSLGYTEENIVSCCETCNFMKSDLTYGEFMNHIEKLYHNFVKPEKEND